MHTEAERAYFAGLIDGEGTITITLSKPQGNAGYQHHAILFSVGTNHEATMEHLKLLWNCKGITERPQAGGRPSLWVLTWTSRAAASVIQEIREFLSIKAAQADIALRMAEEIAERDHAAAPLAREEWQRREQYRLAIRRLNRSRFGLQEIEFREPGPIICKGCGTKFSEYKTRKKMYCTKQCGMRAWQRASRAKRAE